MALLAPSFDDRRKDAQRENVCRRARAVSSANGGIYTHASVHRTAELERQVASMREILGRRAQNTE